MGHKKRKATSTKPTIKLWQRAGAKEGWCTGLSALSRSPGVCKQRLFDLLQQQIVFNIIYETLCFKQTPGCLPADCWKHWHHKRGAWRGPNCQKSVLGSPDGNLMLSYLISYCLSLYQILFGKKWWKEQCRVSPWGLVLVKD